MAGFKTHLSVAVGVSAIVDVVALSVGIVSAKEAVLFFLLGSIGGILPDIDSDSSIPLKFLSFSFGFMIAFGIILAKVDIYSIIELLIAWAILYLIFHYVLLYAFKKFTKHRGMIHSVPAGIMFGILTTNLFYYFFNFTEFKSWLAGLFVFIGFLSHLILDEIYSVDLKGKKLKKSFGTAFKFYTPKDGRSTLIIYVITIFLLYNSPNYNDFVYIFTSSKFYTLLQSNLIPDGIWFADIYNSIKNIF